MSIFSSSMVRYSRTCSLGRNFSVSLLTGLNCICPSRIAVFIAVLSSLTMLNPDLELIGLPNFVLYSFFRKLMKSRQNCLSTSVKRRSSWKSSSSFLRRFMIERLRTPRFFWISRYLSIQLNKVSCGASASWLWTYLLLGSSFFSCRFLLRHITSAFLRVASFFFIDFWSDSGTNTKSGKRS